MPPLYAFKCIYTPNYAPSLSPYTFYALMGLLEVFYALLGGVGTLYALLGGPSPFLRPYRVSMAPLRLSLLPCSLLHPYRLSKHTLRPLGRVWYPLRPSRGSRDPFTPFKSVGC